jgi:hypothetical protein
VQVELLERVADLVGHDFDERDELRRDVAGR